MDALMQEPVALPGTAQRAAPGAAQTYEGLVCERWCDWRELALQRLARRPLAPGQVRLAVHHAGVGFALKLFVAGQYQRKPPLPFVPGTEAAGVVIEVGAGVAQLAPGQRVAAALDWGAFAQEAVVSADTVYPLPPALPLALGAAFAVAGKALGATLAYLSRGADGDQEMLARYHPIVELIRWLLPDLSRLDWREWSMYQLAPGAEVVFWSVTMAVAYIALLLVCASLLLARREFS